MSVTNAPASPIIVCNSDHRFLVEEEAALAGVKPRTVNRFLKALAPEHQLTLLADLVDRWGALGADPAMLGLLKQVARL